MFSIITPRIKSSTFFPPEQADDLFLREQRKFKLEGYVQALAAMDPRIDFSVITGAIDEACPRPESKKGGRPTSGTEVMVRIIFCKGCTTCLTSNVSIRCWTARASSAFAGSALPCKFPTCSRFAFRQRLALGGLAGATGMLQSPVVIEQCGLAVSTDSGTYQMAVAQHVLTLALFNRQDSAGYHYHDWVRCVQLLQVADVSIAAGTAEAPLDCSRRPTNGIHQIVSN